MAKVWHYKKDIGKFPSDAVYIGRPSEWGNPYSNKKNTAAKYLVDSVEKAVEMFENYLDNNSYLLSKLPALKGKDLLCWCKFKGNEPCHGDVLLRRANG